MRQSTAAAAAYIAITIPAGLVTATPAAAADDVQLEVIRTVNDIPYTPRCSTPVVTVYNPTGKNVRGVFILWKGIRHNRWEWLSTTRSLSWQYTPVTVRPYSQKRFKRWVCADWKNTRLDDMSVKAIKAEGIV